MLSHPFRFTNRSDCIEVSAEIYRELLPALKSIPEQEFVNFYEPPQTPAFYCRTGISKRPIRLAVFPNSKPARYFIFISTVPRSVQKLLEKEDRK